MLKKLLDNYKNLTAPVKASLWFLICGFLQKAISMLTTPVFTRIMTETEYGRFSVYNTWLGIAQIVVSLNLAAGVYTRGLVKNEDDQDRFSSAMLGLSTTCILIWCVIYVFFHNAINDLLGLSSLMGAAMLLEVWAHIAYQFWTNREKVAYRYKKLVVLTLLYVILRPVLGVICVLQADLLHQAEARLLATVAVNLVLFTGLYISIFKKGRKFFDRKYWLYALRFNIPLLPHYLSQIVFNQSDRLMINSICGSSEAAYYTVAYTIAMVLQIFNTSVSATMNPWIYKSLKEKEYKKIGKVTYWVLAVIAIINLAVVLIAPEVLHIMAPESYQAALWVIPPVTVSVFFSFLYDVFVTFEFYFEKTHYITTATVVTAVLNIVLNAVLIPKFGFVAAGYTTLLCYILYAFIHYLLMKKITKAYLEDTRIYNAKVIIGLGIGLLAGAAATMLLYRTVLVRYGLLLVICAVALWKRKAIAELIRTMRRK